MNMNPYQTPASLHDAGEEATPEAVDCWCDDDSLVLSEQSELPNVCVYCCGKTTRPVSHRLSVYPPTRAIGLIVIVVFATAFMLLIGLAWPVRSDPTKSISLLLMFLLLIVFVFFVWRFRTNEPRYPTLQTQIPICERHRWLRILPNAAFAILGAVITLDYFGLGPSMVFETPLILVVLCLGHSFLPTQLSAHRHRDGAFWIRGCSDKYLKLLPAWTNS